jgi:transposase
MEACGTAHYWAREIAALGHGGAAHSTSLCQTFREARQNACGGRGGHR